MADKLTAPLVESLTESPEGKTFPVFDGTAYATVPVWAPQSARGRLVADVTVGRQDVAMQVLADADAANERLVRFATNQFAFGFSDASGSPRTLTHPVVTELGGRYWIVIDFYPDRVEMTINGVYAQIGFGVDPADLNMLRIGCNDVAGALFWEGTIHSVQFIDHTPLQAARFMPGDGVSRYAAIPEITLAGDFEIEWWQRGVDPTGDRAVFDSTRFSVDMDDGYSLIYIDDPDGLQLVVGRADATFDRYVFGANTELRGAQDKLCTLRRMGATAEFLIGGAVVNSLPVVTKPITLEGLVWGGTIRANGGTFAGLSVRDLEAGQEWQYNNANDSGNKLKNTGNTGSAFDGVWYEGGSPMTNAAADAARTRLPMISRHYLFDEPGRIKEVLGGGADATLINLDASDWQAE